MKRLLFLLFIIICTGCFEIDSFKPNENTGMRPIYVQLGDDISTEAMEFNDLTNIVVYQELILVLEDNVGIHIIDNSNSMDPINTMFIPITGINDMAIKEDIIIANSGDRLYSLDISDRSKAVLKSITFIEEQSSPGNNFYPIGYNGLFECVDPDKGLIVNWELVDMNDSDCWR